MKKRILVTILILICIIGLYGIIKLLKSNINNQTEEKEENQNINITEEPSQVIISDETKKMVEETIEATENKEDLSTKELITSTQEEEKQIIDEGAIETDAVVEQENISYDGEKTGSGLSLLGAYQ